MPKRSRQMALNPADLPDHMSSHASTTVYVRQEDRCRRS